MISREEQERLLIELKALNEEVTAVTSKRKAWMDAHMADFAKMQVGEPIYDLNTGCKLGVVSKHYRYWDGQRNPLHDTGMDVECEYETSRNIFDNTSRQPGLQYGDAAALESERARKNRKRLESADWDAIFGTSDERPAPRLP